MAASSSNEVDPTMSADWYMPTMNQIREKRAKQISSLSLLKLKGKHLKDTLCEKDAAYQAAMSKRVHLQNEYSQTTAQEASFQSRADIIMKEVDEGKQIAFSGIDSLKKIISLFELGNELFVKNAHVVLEEFATDDKIQRCINKEKAFVETFLGEHEQIVGRTIDEVNSQKKLISSKVRSLHDDVEGYVIKMMELDGKSKELELIVKCRLENLSDYPKKMKVVQNEIEQENSEYQAQENQLGVSFNALENQKKSIDNEVEELETRLMQLKHSNGAAEESAKNVELSLERDCQRNAELFKALGENQAKNKMISAKNESLRSEIASFPESLDHELDEINIKLKNLQDSIYMCEEKIACCTRNLEECNNGNQALVKIQAEADEGLKLTFERAQKATDELETERSLVKQMSEQLSDLKAKIGQITSKIGDNNWEKDGAPMEVNKREQILSEKSFALKQAEARAIELQNQISDAKKILGSLANEVSPQEIDELRNQLERLKEERSELPKILCQHMEVAAAISEKMELIDKKQRALQWDMEQLSKKKQEFELESRRQVEQNKLERDKILDELNGKYKKLLHDLDQGKQDTRRYKSLEKTVQKELKLSFEATTSFCNAQFEVMRILPIITNVIQKPTQVVNVHDTPDKLISPNKGAVNLFESYWETSQELAVKKSKEVRSYQPRAPNKKVTQKPPSRSESPTSTVVSGDEIDADKSFHPWTRSPEPVRAKVAPKPTTSSTTSSMMLAPKNRTPLRKQKTLSRKDVFLGNAIVFNPASPEFVTSTQKSHQDESTPPRKPISKDPYAFDSSSDDNPFLTRTTYRAPQALFSENKNRNENGDSSDNIVHATPPRPTKRRLLGPINDAVFASQSDGETDYAPSTASKYTIPSLIKIDKKRKKMDVKRVSKPKKK